MSRGSSDWSTEPAIRIDGFAAEVNAVSPASKSLRGLTWSTSSFGSPGSVGPAGTANSAYLQGKIGDKLYRINTGLTLTAESDGNLSLRMEDSTRTDNSGFVTVTINKKAE